MSKMIDKDELEFLRKMVKEGNIESKLNKGVGELPIKSSIDDLPILPSSAQKNLSRHTSKEVSDKVSDSLKKSILSGISKKGVGKAAALAGPLGMLLSGASEAFDASSLGPEMGSEDYDIETMSPEQREEKEFFENLRETSLSRAKDTMGRQDRESDIEEKIKLDDKIYDIANQGKSSEALEDQAMKEKLKRTILQGLRSK